MGRSKDKGIDTSTIYGRTKYLRKELLDMTQEDFGYKINLSKGNISNIEIGRVAATERVIADICSTYSVNEDWLIYGTGEPFKEVLPEDEFSHAAASVAGENDIFAMEALKEYYALDPVGKKVLKNFILSLADKIRKEDENS